MERNEQMINKIDNYNKTNSNEMFSIPIGVDWSNHQPGRVLLEDSGHIFLPVSCDKVL